MRKKVFRFKTITVKLLLPVSLIIVLSLASAGIFAYTQESKILTDAIKAEAQGGITEVVNSMKTSDIAVSEVKKELANNYISRAKLVAQLLSKDEGLLSVTNLQGLASEIGVDEIHISDENGILKWGNIGEFIDFDFASSDQSKDFLALINDKTGVIVQDPQPRGTDKMLFQYIGVSRIDKPGIVQIGVKPEVVQKLTDMLGTEQDIKSRRLSETGYFFLVDKEGIVIAHPKDEDKGLDIKQFDWGQRLLKEKNGDFVYTYKGVTKRVYFKQHNDMYICATIPTVDYLTPLNKLKLSIAMVSVIAILLSILIIYLVSNGIIIRPLKKIMSLMEKAEHGDLTVLSDNVSKDEIGQLSQSFNNMIGDIKGLVKATLDMVEQVSESADALAATSQQSAASTTEVANTIQQIASAATEAAKSADRGAEITNNLALEIENASVNSKQMRSISDEAQKLNQKGSESMDYLTKKFDDNTKIGMEVGKSVSNLDSKSKNIVEIINMITSIANQTNLLSLNAAIEAARAGESGRGFAVVAEEIRKLAEQSAKGADEISKIITGIRNETELTVRAMDEAGKIIGEANNALIQSNIIFGDINEANKKVAMLINKVDEDIVSIENDKNEIVKLVNNMAVLAQDSAASSQEVAATTEEQSAAVEEVTASAQELSNMARQLQKTAAKFKIQ